MTPDAVAAATAKAVSDLPSRYMLDMATYVTGGEAGFDGVDFYVAGRGGALGDVPADVVTAAFVFFAPGLVSTSWERSASVMSRSDAADHWAAACHRWAEEHMGDHDGLPRLAELIGKINASADVAGASSFAAWRTRPEPDTDRPRALALHRLMVLRELRGALHGAAVLSHGLSPHAALSIRTPGMLPVLGWDAPHPDADTTTAKDAWAAAEGATDHAIAPAYAVLDRDESAELVELLSVTVEATT